MLLRGGRKLAVRRRSQRWRKSLVCANRRPSPVSSSFLFLARTPDLNVSPGLLSKLKISKREKPTSQAPDLCPSPSFEGRWVTLWAYQASEEQDYEPDQDVATPTDATAWSSDEELTPRFSDFPRTLYPNALTGEGQMESSWEPALQLSSSQTHYSE